VTLTAPRADGEYYVSLEVVDRQGRADRATTYFVVREGRPRLPNLSSENPAWVEKAVVYGVVPHNFGPRGFRSVFERLDYLRDLGVNTLWLSPCTATPGEGHGYAVSDYFDVRRDYGTRREFKGLIRAAHARGLRVLMDFVPNHSSVHHPYMQDALARGRASPYHGFYEWDRKGGGHQYYFHWRHLPNLNYDNPQVCRWMLEAFSYWVRECDVDGFRVDVAWGVRLRRPSFWPAWRRELKRIKPDLLLLAEATARDPYYFRRGFDAAYDWTDEPGKWSWEHVFEDPDQIVLRLRSALTPAAGLLRSPRVNEGRAFHRDALVFRFLNNNDTGPRFLSRYGPEMEKVAAAMLLSLPGLPCIYTGQEVGAEFEPYKTPGPISWENRHGLRGYYRRLIALRGEHPSLRSRDWELMEVRSAEQVLAYCRCGGGGSAPVLVVLNFSPRPAWADIRIPRASCWQSTGGMARDLLTGTRVALRASGRGLTRVTLPRLSARFLSGAHSSCGG
jgi:glycosidase